jgi:hypothetical protein
MAILWVLFMVMTTYLKEAEILDGEETACA